MPVFLQRSLKINRDRMENKRGETVDSITLKYLERFNRGRCIFDSLSKTHNQRGGFQFIKPPANNDNELIKQRPREWREWRGRMGRWRGEGGQGRVSRGGGGQRVIRKLTRGGTRPSPCVITHLDDTNRELPPCICSSRMINGCRGGQRPGSAPFSGAARAGSGSLQVFR